MKDKNTTEPAELPRDVFSPVCCWSCKHCILDISKGRRYFCQANHRELKQNPHTPMLCKQYVQG